jgi:nitrate reductase gamma subunit
MALTVITHAALLIFLIGIAIRIWRIAAMPIHVRWELYPIPSGAAEKIFYMVSEVLRLEGVRKNNRSLWFWSWLFHVALYLMIGFACLALVASFSATVRGSIIVLISVASFVSYTFGIAGTCGLIVMRLADSRLRPMTSFGDLLNLALLLAIFLTGFAHAMIQPSAADILVAQAGNFLWINPAPQLHPLAVAHLCLISLFVSYMPLTRMAHMVLKYFTYHSVRWDDRAAGEMPGHLARMRKNLAYPVQWSAHHIQSGESRSSWADAVMTNGVREKKVERH